MDKELIEHIATQLHHHEESYSTGAWERFNEKNNKKPRFVIWPLWVAAALILVFGGTFLLLNQQNHKTDLVIAKPKAVEKKLVEKNSVVNAKNRQVKTITLSKQINISAKEDDEVPKNISGLNNQPQILVADLDKKPKDPIIKIENHNTLNNSLTNIPLTSYRNRKFEIAVERKREKAFKKPTFEDLLAHDSKISELKTTAKSAGNSKWEQGLYVAPTMGNDNKVNMNYGFSLAYNLADKLSISSGIAYSSLSSTSNPASQKTVSSDASPNAMPVSGAISSYSSSSAKSLESVNANVRGINIPLELKYNINKKLYTGIGVSALAILNNKQNNNYLVSSGKNITVANSAGIAEQRMLIVTDRVSESQTQTSNFSDKYIGFYNFSLGYKQKISKKTDFAVEPFLRLPMKTFSKDNLNLTNGGLKLKFDF